MRLLIFIISLVKAQSLYAEITLRSDVITGLESQNIVRDSPLNPQNDVFLLKDPLMSVELRPYLHIEQNHGLSLDLRPRFLLNCGSTPHTTKNPDFCMQDIWLNEGYISYAHSTQRAWQIHLGRQIYLWGPSEVVSPSNPFYSDILNRPNPLFLIEGTTMARFNIALTPNWGLTLLSEIDALKDRDFETRYDPKSQEKNQKRSLLKFEWSSDDGGDQASVIIGQHRQPTLNNDTSLRNFFAATFMKTFNSYFQTYADLRIDNQASALSPYITGGVRYTFQEGMEWRNEFIYKRAGFSNHEKQNYENGLSPENQLTYLHRLRLNSGMLFSEHYVYTSLRDSFSDFAFLQDPLWGLRVLHSTDHEDGIGSAFLEGGVGASLTLVTYVARSYGKKNGEFNSLVKTAGGVLLRVSY